MRTCWQSAQRSTWPPSRDVRQASIAPMTRSWPALTWPRLTFRQASPWQRKTSATCNLERDMIPAQLGSLRCSKGLSVLRIMVMATRA